MTKPLPVPAWRQRDLARDTSGSRAGRREAGSGVRTTDLTREEIEAHARAEGFDVLADWIADEQSRREEARRLRETAPLVTEAGEIEVGPHYNVTLLDNRRERKLKNVQLRRDFYFPCFVYPTGMRVHIYSGVKVIRFEKCGHWTVAA